MFRPTSSRIFLIRFAVLLLLTFMFANIGAAQPGPMEQPDLTIDAATRTKVIDGILKRLNDSYVFPEVAEKDGAVDQGTGGQEGIRSGYERERIRNQTNRASASRE